MKNVSLFFQNITFSYESAANPLLQDVVIQFAQGWKGITRPNGSGKSTILKLAAGFLSPQNGRIIIPGLAVYCEQGTDNIPKKLSRSY